MENAILLLEKWAALLRYDTIRMISNANSGHPGGALSAADIITALFFQEMKIRPEEPTWPDRDRFILSKGHACPVYYAALARRGFFPVSELKTLRQAGSRLHGHPKLVTPGVDMTSGSLGQGLSIGAGMAMAGKMDGRDYRVFVMLGCGELNEGQNYEAIMAAYHFKLSNLTAIVDYNGLQFDGRLEDVLNPGSLVRRWEGFNWKVISIDGHSMAEILAAFETVRNEKDLPCVIIARTVKGKGVNMMEDDYLWHSLMNNQALTEFCTKRRKELENADEFYARRLW